MWFEFGGLLRTDMSKILSNQIDDNEYEWEVYILRCMSAKLKHVKD